MGLLPQGALIQAGVWIRRFSWRLQPKAAAAPKRGRGPRTDTEEAGVNIREFEVVLFTSTLNIIIGKDVTKNGLW
jgi:hypothetical protein